MDYFLKNNKFSKSREIMHFFLCRYEIVDVGALLVKINLKQKIFVAT